MKKTLSLFMTLALLTACGNADTTDVPPEKTLSIVTSLYPLEYFAREVAGERATVVNVTPTGMEPHDYEPTPQDLIKIQNADLLILQGAEMEPWAKNISDIRKEKPVLVIAENFELISHDLDPDDSPPESAEHDTEHEEEHDPESGLDPHLWLDPLLALRQAELIRDEMIKINPENADEYTDNADYLIFRLEMLHEEYMKGFKKCGIKDAMTSHDAFSYLGKRYGITFHSIAGLSPQDEPSARELSHLVELMKEKSIEHVYTAGINSDDMTMTLASEAGGLTLILNPIESLTSKEIKMETDYLKIMKNNLSQLRIGLKCFTP